MTKYLFFPVKMENFSQEYGSKNLKNKVFALTQSISIAH
jgi:hypothetical protein